MRYLLVVFIVLLSCGRKEEKFDAFNEIELDRVLDTLTIKINDSLTVNSKVTWKEKTMYKYVIFKNYNNVSYNQIDTEKNDTTHLFKYQIINSNSETEEVLNYVYLDSITHYVYEKRDSDNTLTKVNY
ncbi:hypothetical protein [Flavobacterium sp.]|uniref:hypothetical protein n=1 Tax=Flavobacterium sp. TaxID=239 RepID=UPI0040478C29